MTDLVFYSNTDFSKATTITNSLIVAKVFNRRHDKLLETIRSVIEDLQGQKGALPLYRECFYINNNNRKMPMYEFDRDFFMLLVMYMRGKDVMQLKLQFINAFNIMEHELQHRNETRLLGKQIRRKLTDTLQVINDLENDPNWKKWSFKLYSDLIYKKALGKTSNQLKREKNIKGKSLRDYLLLEEIEKVNQLEMVVDLFIFKNKLYLLSAKQSYQKVKEFLENYEG